MKLPFVIFSLVLIYWICMIHADEDVNSKKDEIDSDTEDALDHQYVSLEKSLLRHKRGSLPVIDMLSSTNLMSKIFLKTLGVGIKPMLNLCKFMYDALNGNGVCSKTEDFSMKNLISIMNPTKTIKTIKGAFCTCLNTIGEANRVALRKVMKTAVDFGMNVMMPKVVIPSLTMIRKSGILPKKMCIMIDTFIAAYNLMNMAKKLL
ncbi:hypothetical protein EAI_10681 [Harpegnathos saltator]|uniref:Uncharacterized protein n=1 Tax=Harpegnathos saltator TaxID=610380 RepID=E2BE69_HARSA|nr:hypothetical protein EAI_10681 [Harpegnathos saltator]